MQKNRKRNPAFLQWHRRSSVDAKPKWEIFQGEHHDEILVAFGWPFSILAKKVNRRWKKGCISIFCICTRMKN